jgi:AcrR family transcriptional regulator
MPPAPSTTRDALLDAAYDAAVQGDWSHVRMLDVATAAGVSRQTLYNEFGSKDALAQALAMREVERFISGSEAALEEANPADPGEAVRLSALYTLQTAADDPLLKAAIVDEAGGLLSFITTRGEPAIAAAKASFVNYYTTHFAHVPLATIDLAAETIVRLTISYLTLPGTQPAEAVADRLADLARKLLMEGNR